MTCTKTVHPCGVFIYVACQSMSEHKRGCDLRTNDCTGLKLESPAGFVLVSLRVL